MMLESQPEQSERLLVGVATAFRNVTTRRYRARMDIEVILDAAETEAPGLRDLARRFLETDAAHLGVPLDKASVLARRAEGVPEVHVTAAADGLLGHMAAVSPDTVKALAWVLLAVSQAELRCSGA